MYQLLEQPETLVMTIRNFNRGKFFKDGNPDDGIPVEDIDKIVIPAGSEQSVSCGLSGAVAGVEGTIDLYDDTAKICTLYWSYPWASPTPDFEVQGMNKAYLVALGSWNAALGSIAIDVAIKG
ncbi:Aegerolysin family protein [Hygrophoropsis aurantiaca]|uniref:Aegerolysin family protein n=1 Tax=Hygrophoropsis aurantiaca TaxID=72124 RepID=A0ACB7ZYH4_9AGAM|nr:Aegerolysin family protein [Hygrophoropsis aurantiaca]